MRLHALGKNRNRKLESEQHREYPILKDIDIKAKASPTVRDTKLSSSGSRRVTADESCMRERGLVGMKMLPSLCDSGATIPHWPLPAGLISLVTEY